MSPQAHTAQNHKHEPEVCKCPACMGLVCLDRPRYFAGQLLTESDFNSEQAYNRAKHRLHNRYLHGPGVVCGLEVLCHDCEGHVTVRQGLAIDPCGNDIVVCEDQDFDLIGEIRRCLRERRKPDRCKPWQPTRDESCKDVDKHWYVTLCYEEKEGRPVTPLKPSKPTGQCGCQPCRGSCGCRCHAEKSVARPVPIDRATACEPTRVFEGFRIGVMEAGPDHPKTLAEILVEMLKGSLLEGVVECVMDVLDHFAKHIAGADCLLLIEAAFAEEGSPPNPNVNAQKWHGLCCALKDAVVDLYVANPHGIRCVLPRALDKVQCPPAPQVMTQEYYEQIRASIEHLFGFVLQYILDCICLAILPKCKPDPVEDCLILAHVTVRGDDIVQICNWSRRHAGSFPSLYYWLGAYPYIPMIGALVKWLCCLPDLVTHNSPFSNQLKQLLGRIDPKGELWRTVAADNFAIVRKYQGRLQNMGERFSIAGIADAVGGYRVNLATLEGKPLKDAQVELEREGVAAAVVDVGSLAEVPIHRGITSVPLARRGDYVNLYVERSSGNVLAAHTQPGTTAKAQESGDEAALRAEVTELRRQVETLTKTVKTLSETRRAGDD